MVPTRLGDIEVTVMASSLIGKDVVTRKLHVEVTSIPFFLSISCSSDATFSFKQELRKFLM